MDESDRFEIRFRYVLIGGDSFLEKELSPAAYWESDGAPYDLDSVPVHAFAEDYLAEPVRDLRRIELVLVDRLLKRERRLVKTFWAGGKAEVAEISDTDGRWWELIVTLPVRHAALGIEGAVSAQEILRYGSLGGGVSGLVSHARVVDLMDGTQLDQPIYSVISDESAVAALGVRTPGDSSSEV